MDLTSILLAPVRVPIRIGQALDDLATLAERARRDPDPVEEARDRIDALLVELVAARTTLHADTRELIDGGERLTEVVEQVEPHMRVFRAALPRLLRGVEVAEDLEGAVETVAETVEPLQGAAERVGRVTNRLSRRSG